MSSGTSVPVLLVGGLAARPEVFAEREVDFAALLGRIEIKGRSPAPAATTAPQPD